MRYYVYATHTDDTRNRPQRKTFRTTRPGDNYFIRMFPAQNVVKARVEADCMRHSLLCSADWSVTIALVIGIDVEPGACKWSR